MFYSFFEYTIFKTHKTENSFAKKKSGLIESGFF
jgi:hypothetical protein